MLDQEMTQRVVAASARHAGKHNISLQCFACGCPEGLCFVVLKRKSVQKMKQQGRCIRCPIHHSKTSSSSYTRKFYSIIHSLDCDVHGIVWDWFDVPEYQSNSHMMHIDATVFCGEACIRFEIDGETHFHHNNAIRDSNDECKDSILREHGVGMLRLHYMDVERWRRYVVSAVESRYTDVHYTASYQGCLDPEEQDNVVVL